VVSKLGILINSVCEYCGSPAGWDTFRSLDNMKEFNLSGACQSCQDETPGEKGKVPSSIFTKTKKIVGFKSSCRKRIK